ncbi:unnamed protein product [Peronospora belbahrii]|uniref:MYND-type domain-containing protein n=1 Tax=Peronospora belbahrii TaxID=622444 RepID=A0AAU9KP57_9STRA|nr:unnamed protein product [Peronospora belbahrii]
MTDTESDDELMIRLTSSMKMNCSAYYDEDCAYCEMSNALVACTMCHQAIYCNEICKRKHARIHRNLCLQMRIEREGAKDDESDSDSDSDSDSNDDTHENDDELENKNVVHTLSSRHHGRAKAGAGDIAIRGLSPVELEKLLHLATKADIVTTNSSLDKLQNQISQLMADKKNRLGTRERGASGASLQEIKALQKKLNELEQKTQSVAFASRTTNLMTMATVVYTPLLVKDDRMFKKYFHLKGMNMPIDQIKIKMKAEGVNPGLLDTPDAVSPNDPGPENGAYIPMTVANDPAFKKYFKLKDMEMSIDQIRMKMESDGVDPTLLDKPSSVSPNDPGPPLQISTGYPSNGKTFPSSIYENFSWPSMPAAVVSYEPLYVKDDPKYTKYFKLQKMGMPDEQIKLKLKAEKVEPDMLDYPDEVSPSDPGPPVHAPVSPTGPVSMEQLFSILMQQQQMIQQVSNGTGLANGVRGRGSSGDAVLNGMPPWSVEDQMAQELAAAESAIDDIFGDESQQSKGPGGMSMIEQLEKKARKESNKKLVENREKVNHLVAELLTTKVSTDEEAISFYKTIAPKLEEFGLVIGTDSVQTWSSRLLIKNKETRDWCFSEQERLDAGKAYGRLWGLSFLERDAGQLITKRAQILNAPATLRAMAKGKPELIDKFTQLLKDTVKLKHKVFKSSLYATEVRRLHQFDIPERFEKRGTELIDSTTMLADASMDIAEEEFRSLENATRAKKIRALTAIHVAEEMITLVKIVMKIGAKGVNELRLHEVEANLAKIKEVYVTGEKEEDEEEDDVL